MWCGVVLVALAACDAGAPTCKDAVAKAVKSGALTSGDEQAILAESCESRKWSGDVRGCLSRATSSSDITTCLRPVIVDYEADAASRRASADAKAAADRVQALETERASSLTEIDAAVTAVANATNDAERSTATATLSAARTKMAELDARLAAAIAKATAACLDNPLAPNCQ